MVKKFILDSKTIIFQNGIMGNNTILFLHSDKVIIVDPSFDLEHIFKEYLNGMELIIFLTHSHYDHIGNFGIIKKYAKEIYISASISEMFKDIRNDSFCKRLFFGSQSEINLKDFILVNDNDEIYGFKFISTPGHSLDSMCIMNDNFIITGDHLFIEDIGRTDFPFSDSNMMNESLIKIKKILLNNMEKIVIPGHGEWDKARNVLISNYYIKDLLIM